MYKTFTDTAFDEDRRLVEQQQALISSDSTGTPLRAFAFDRAGMAARKVIKRKIVAEQGSDVSAA